MCSGGSWRKIPNKSSFARSLSPFEDWFLDVRVLPDPSRLVEISTELGKLFSRFVLVVFRSNNYSYGKVDILGRISPPPHGFSGSGVFHDDNGSFSERVRCLLLWGCNDHRHYPCDINGSLSG
ncbi:hypothetical protein KSP40_PGU011329 [Platanthera guangdongensis]|uniref:Uncharacterized protein n=1 Tax=Platanthera guangdongensis TaxID=2320717 RepID=A0ABR2MIG7_9ASPA